jgi:hypothetical protein
LRCNICAEQAEQLYIIIHSGYFSTLKVLMSYAGFIFSPMNALNRCSFATLFPPTPKPSCLSTSFSVAACIVVICADVSGNPATSVLSDGLTSSVRARSQVRTYVLEIRATLLRSLLIIISKKGLHNFEHVYLACMLISIASILCIDLFHYCINSCIDLS